MKKLLSNLRFILKRYKLSTVLNIVGLSVAFAAFLVIVMQVWLEFTYNTEIKDKERIFMVVCKSTENENFTYLSYPWIEAIANASEPASEAAFINPLEGERHFYINDNYVKHNRLFVSENFPEIFGFEMVAGTLDCLEDDNAAMIPQSMALRYFGTVDVIGKSIDRGSDLYIGGVYKDFKRNCFIKNIIYLKQAISEWQKSAWGSNNYTTFIKVAQPSVIEEVRHGANQRLEEMNKTDNYVFRDAFEFLPMNQLHKVYVIGSPDTPTSSITIYMLISIAVAIILIASINYVNFANSLIPVRLKNINTQKILGATNGSLRLVLVVESVVIAIVSYLLALLFVFLLGGSSLAEMTDAGLSLTENETALWLTAAVALAVGVIAGLIPAYRATSYSPAVALKGNFGLSPRGKALRTLSIGSQFFISALLIMVAIFMMMQRNFLTHSADYGFEKDEVLVCDIGYPAEMPSDRSVVYEQIKKLPYVVNVSASWSTMAEKDNTQGWIFRTATGENIDPGTLFVDANYLETMGIKLIEGRDFKESDTAAIIVNALTRDKFKESVDVGKVLRFSNSYEIVGICDNANFSSLYTEAEPILLVKHPYNMNILSIRVAKGTNMFEAVEGIKTQLNTFDPIFPFEVRMYDQILDDTYQKENRLSGQITIFSILAVFISIIGVFGLVMFDSEYRKREIAIRKVFGATTGSILKMFNIRYMVILFVSFIFASVASWVIMGRWLENFAYKITLNPLIVLATFLLLAIIISLTVTFQSLKIASSNPIESLKNE